MATVEKKVVNDSPSQKLDELRKEFNKLLVLIEAAADLDAIQTGLGNGTAKEVKVDVELPNPPQFPTKLS